VYEEWILNEFTEKQSLTHTILLMQLMGGNQVLNLHTQN